MHSLFVSVHKFVGDGKNFPKQGENPSITPLVLSQILTKLKKKFVHLEVHLLLVSMESHLWSQLGVSRWSRVLHKSLGVDSAPMLSFRPSRETSPSYCGLEKNGKKPSLTQKSTQPNRDIAFSELPMRKSSPTLPGFSADFF